MAGAYLFGTPNSESIPDDVCDELVVGDLHYHRIVGFRWTGFVYLWNTILLDFLFRCTAGSFWEAAPFGGCARVACDVQVESSDTVKTPWSSPACVWSVAVHLRTSVASNDRF